MDLAKVVECAVVFDVDFAFDEVSFADATAFDLVDVVDSSSSDLALGFGVTYPAMDPVNVGFMVLYTYDVTVFCFAGWKGASIADQMSSPLGQLNGLRAWWRWAAW